MLLLVVLVVEVLVVVVLVVEVLVVVLVVVQVLVLLAAGGVSVPSVFAFWNLARGVDWDVGLGCL